LVGQPPEVPGQQRDSDPDIDRVRRLVVGDRVEYFPVQPIASSACSRAAPPLLDLAFRLLC
jgi:hypothetical protein